MSTTVPALPIARRIRVTGLVQGIGYRAWAVRTAEDLGIAGWARNRLDGSVEIVAVGEPGKIARFIDACRNGPRMARVDDIATEATQGIVPRGFAIKPTV